MSSEILSSGRRAGARCATCQLTVTIAVIAMMSGVAVAKTRSTPTVAMRTGGSRIDGANDTASARANVRLAKRHATATSPNVSAMIDIAVPITRAGVVPKATSTR